MNCIPNCHCRGPGGTGRVARLAPLAAAAAVLGIFCSGAAQQGIQIQARLIHATKEGDGSSDSRLRDIEQQLRSLFRFSSYKLVSQKSATVAPGKPQNVKLSGSPDCTVGLTLQGPPSGQATVQVQLLWNSRPILNTTVRLSRGANVILGGPPDGKGGSYMLALKWP